MFSDHPTTMGTVPANMWWWVTGVVLLVVQLVALGLVVQGQVRAAELSRAQMAQQRLAIAHCMQSSKAASRTACLAQFTEPGVRVDKVPEQIVVSNTADFSHSDAQVQGKLLKPVTFTARK